MAKFIFIASILLLASISLAAQTKVRVGHAIPNVGSVNVAVDGAVVFSNQNFGQLSTYQLISSGEHVVSVQADNNVTFHQNITVSDYTTSWMLIGLSVENSTAPVTIFSVQDDNTAPVDATTARVKFVHVSPNIPSLEVYVAEKLTFGPTSYAHETAYVDIAAGTYNITLRNNDGSLAFTQTTLVGGGVYSVFAEGVLHPNETQGLRVVVVQDAAYTYFQVRLAHTVANAGDVTIQLRDNDANTTVAGTLAYKQFSTYLNAVKGTYTVTLFSGAQKLFSTTPDWSNAGNLVTVAAIGKAGHNETELNVALFNDDNTVPLNGTVARVKFVHTSPDAPAVDIYANDDQLFSGIAYGSQSTYASVPTGFYNIQVKSGGNVVLNIPGLQLAGGVVYSIYAEGWVNGSNTEALTAVPNQDAIYRFINFRIITSISGVNQGNVQVSLDNTPIGTFNDFSVGNYLNQVVPSTFDFAVTVEGNTYNFNSPLVPDAYQTVLISGSVANGTQYPIALTVTQDDVSFPETGNVVKAKFVHGSAGAPNVDVKVNGQLVFSNVGYKQTKVASWTETLGSVNVTVFEAGTEKQIYFLPLNQDSYYGALVTLLAYGVFGANQTQPFSVAFHMDTKWFYSPARVAHLVSDAGVVTVSLYYGVTLVKAFPADYNTISQYVDVPILPSLTAVITSGNTYVHVQRISYATTNPVTFAVLGLAAAQNGITVYSFNDDNTAPVNSQKGRVRVIHSVVGAGPVNVNLNDLQVFSVSYAVPSDYTSFDATEYRVDVYLNGGLHPIISGIVPVTGGDVVTIILEGDASKPNTLKVYPVQDVVYQYFGLRLVHAAPNAGSVDVKLDNTIVAHGLVFTNITSFVPLPWSASPRTLSVVSGTNTVLSQDFTFEVNKDLTVAIAGDAPNVTYSFVSVANDYVVPPNGATYTTVQFVHLVTLAPAVDVYLNHTKIATDVSYGHRSPYLTNLPAGEVHVAVVAGNDTVFQTNLVLTAGNVFTLYAVGMLGGNVFALVSNDYSPLPEFRIRIVHASPDSGALDVLVGNQLFFNKVEYATASKYNALDDGTYDLVVRPYDNVTYTLFTIPKQQLHKFNDYTFLLGGLVHTTNHTIADKFNGVVLVDENKLPAEGKVSLRFVHAVVGIEHVDLKIGADVAFKSVSFLQSTNYSTVEAKVVEFSVVIAGSETPVFPATAFDLKSTSSAVYTIVAQGEYPNNVKVVTYLDAGGSPPPQQSSSSKKHKGLTGLQIGLIIGGVALFVIIVAAVAFVLYTKRKQRRGYTEIESRQPAE